MRNGVQFRRRCSLLRNGLKGELFVVFKRMWHAMGVGGPSVETVLTNPGCRPGGFLEGHVQVSGAADRALDVEYLAVALTTRVEVTAGDREFTTDREFHRQRLTGSFQLEAGARLDMPFRIDMPWEIPITELYGQHLHGMTMRLSTELEIAHAVDRSDLDAIAVHPLPAQERILDALLRLGFRFSRAEVDHGKVPGAEQTLPFRQQIDFLPPSAYAARINQLGLIFLPTAESLQVVLEIDRRADRPDTRGRFDVDYATVDEIDWAAELDGWLRRR
ncbi:MAG: sporulation-control protein [Actinoplanes sp.]|nr:sporulation-control protein [Actinoplanes sp.]